MRLKFEDWIEIGGWSWNWRMKLKLEDEIEIGGWNWNWRMKFKWDDEVEIGGWSWKEMLRNPKLPVKEISSPVLHLIAANSVCSFVCTSFSVLEGLILTTTFKKFLKLTKSRQTFYSDCWNPVVTNGIHFQFTLTNILNF